MLFLKFEMFSQFLRFEMFLSQNYRHLSKWGLVTSYKLNKVGDEFPRGY